MSLPQLAGSCLKHRAEAAQHTPVWPTTQAARATCKSEARSTGEKKDEGKETVLLRDRGAMLAVMNRGGKAKAALCTAFVYFLGAKTWRTKVAWVCDGKYLAMKTWKDSVSSRCKQTRSATPKDWPTFYKRWRAQKANVWCLVSQRQAKPIIIMASERLVFLLVGYRTQGLINFWLVSNSGGRLGLLLSWSRSRFPNSKLPFILSHCYDKHSLKTPSWSQQLSTGSGQTTSDFLCKMDKLHHLFHRNQ